MFQLDFNRSNQGHNSWNRNFI